MLHTLFLSNKNDMELASKLAERLTDDDTEYRRLVSDLSPPILALLNFLPATFLVWTLGDNM
jgi:hypothetical protein